MTTDQPADIRAIIAETLHVAHMDMSADRQEQLAVMIENGRITREIINDNDAWLEVYYIDGDPWLGYGRPAFECAETIEEHVAMRMSQPIYSGMALIGKIIEARTGVKPIAKMI